MTVRLCVCLCTREKQKCLTSIYRHDWNDLFFLYNSLSTLQEGDQANLHEDLFFCLFFSFSFLFNALIVADWFTFIDALLSCPAFSPCTWVSWETPASDPGACRRNRRRRPSAPRTSEWTDLSGGERQRLRRDKLRQSQTESLNQKPVTFSGNSPVALCTLAFWTHPL